MYFVNSGLQPLHPSWREWMFRIVDGMLFKGSELSWQVENILLYFWLVAYRWWKSLGVWGGELLTARYIASDLLLLLLHSCALELIFLVISVWSCGVLPMASLLNARVRWLAALLMKLIIAWALRGGILLLNVPMPFWVHVLSASFAEE